MSRRLLKHHQEDARAKIQVAKIIGRLQQHIDGECELTATQVQSARILLDKSISNAQTDLNVSGNVNITWPVAASKREA